MTNFETNDDYRPKFSTRRVNKWWRDEALMTRKKFRTGLQFSRMISWISWRRDPTIWRSPLVSPSRHSARAPSRFALPLVSACLVSFRPKIMMNFGQELWRVLACFNQTNDDAIGHWRASARSDFLKNVSFSWAKGSFSLEFRHDDGNWPLFKNVWRISWHFAGTGFL